MTREDVARAAGVSRPTVSRVLNNNGYVLLNPFYVEVYKGMEAKDATTIFAFIDMLAI